MNTIFPRSFALVLPSMDTDSQVDEATGLVLLQLTRADPLAMEELIESGVLNRVLGIPEPLFDASPTFALSDKAE